MIKNEKRSFSDVCKNLLFCKNKKKSLKEKKYVKMKIKYNATW